jgi:hypothetical protein
MLHWRSSWRQPLLASCKPSPANEARGEFGEALMHEQVSVLANGEAFELAKMEIACSTTQRILPSPMIFFRPRCGMIS